jgi:arylsulfatase
MGRLSENSVLNLKNKSHAVTAGIVVPANGAEGVIVAQGGNIGGWSLYVKGGKLKYCYNLLSVKLSFIEGTQPIPAGKHQVRMEFKYDGGGLAKGGAVSLYVDGKKDGEGRLGMTIPMIFSADETCNVGRDEGSPVSPDYSAGDNSFSGIVNWVQLDLGKDDHDHLISPEERFQVAMARQ